MSELRRLIVQHRHVAPMVSALLAGIDASIRVRDAGGEVILDRAGSGSDVAGAPARHDVTVDGEVIGSVEGGRAARGIAAVLSYAAARERDKRSLANEALERYRELSLIYDLADVIGVQAGLESIVTTAADELGRLPNDALGFVLLLDPGGRLVPAPGTEPAGTIVAAHAGEGIVGSVVASGTPELVERTMDDPRATADERGFGTLVVAPLRVGDETLGVIGAGGHGGAFRAADLKVVTAVASLAGPAVARALAATTPGRPG